MTPEAKANWERIAADSRSRSAEQTDRKHRAYALTGRACGGREMEAAFEEAREIAEGLRKEDGLTMRFDVFPVAPTGINADSIRHKTRAITGDYVAVHADVLIGMEAELAEALAAMHHARANLAEWMAGRSDMISMSMEREQSGLANVAAGKKWSDE